MATRNHSRRNGRSGNGGPGGGGETHQTASSAAQSLTTNQGAPIADNQNSLLVGNNIPVFFIQDALKFPDLVHSVKMEPDRGFPQNASAHDTFWDFVSLMPESMHMLMWTMSDRAIPRSLRMIEGFGVNTFRFVNAQGRSTFVKFHWRPVIGAASVLWDEAVKINGADQDFHRRDLWTAIERGDYPEFEFAIQTVDEAHANELAFDILDATKLIPEELVPLQVIGKLTLNRNPDNFFAETEQVAFCPANLVPGIEFSNDPLLQGRVFSYLDTQLIRLGGPNFHDLEINRPKCPMRNFQRDGHMRMTVPSGRVAYEPNSLDPAGPREDPQRGFTSVAAEEHGAKQRVRSETFADHYSQARLFWRSMSEPEQRHIANAFAFELGKVETVAIRRRMLGHLDIIDAELGSRVAHKLGMEGQAEAISPARRPIELDPSPALSLVKKAPRTLAGRVVGVLAADGSDRALIDRLRAAVADEGGRVDVVAPKVGGAHGSDGKPIAVDHALAGGPSVLFDAVVVAVAGDSVQQLLAHPSAIDWVRDAFAHLKIIGHVPDAAPLLERAGIEADEGVVAVASAKNVGAFITAAKGPRTWNRERAVEERTEGAPPRKERTARR